MNLTSSTCKFLQSYLDCWQQGLNGKVFLSLFQFNSSFDSAIDQENSLELLSSTSFSTFFHLLSHSLAVSIVSVMFALSSRPICLFFLFLFFMGSADGVDSTHLPRLLSDSLAVFHFHLVMEWMMIPSAHNHYLPGQHETSWNLRSHPSSL